MLKIYKKFNILKYIFYHFYWVLDFKLEWKNIRWTWSNPEFIRIMLRIPVGHPSSGVSSASVSYRKSQRKAFQAS